MQVAHLVVKSCINQFFLYYIASPVCLPWSDYLEDSHPARDIKDVDNEGEIQEVVITGWGRHR